MTVQKKCLNKCSHTKYTISDEKKAIVCQSCKNYFIYKSKDKSESENAKYS